MTLTTIAQVHKSEQRQLKKVTKLIPSNNISYEFGIRFKNRLHETKVAVFLTNMFERFWYHASNDVYWQDWEKTFTLWVERLKNFIP